MAIIIMFKALPLIFANMLSGGRNNQGYQQPIQSSATSADIQQLQLEVEKLKLEVEKDRIKLEMQKK